MINTEMDTTPLPVKIELRLALSLLKQGKTLEALKKFEFLQSEMKSQQHSDLSTVILNYSLALNMLYDRNLAAAKESLYHEDELNTAIGRESLSFNTSFRSSII